MNKTTKEIRCSQHSIAFSNAGKLEHLSSFINEYRRVAKIYLDHIWDNGYEWKDNKGTEHIFSIRDKRYDHPRYIDYNFLKMDTDLSARSLSSMVTQLCGVIGASVEKQRKRLYVLDRIKKEKSTPSHSLLKKIEDNIPMKPDISSLLPELSSKCADLEIKDGGKFNAYLRLKSLGKAYGHIKIPIKYTKISNKWMNKGKLLNSYQISNKNIWFRYELPEVKFKSEGEIIGADQGKKTVLSFSNEITTPKTDIHGHSLDSIILKMSRKKKGSKNFSDAQKHRLNFINWSINQLDLRNIKQINLEKIINIGYKNNRGRLMSHWTNTLIRDKLMSFATQHEVRVKLQDSTYRSQRCSSCGFVLNSNRNKKDFSCIHCGLSIDADINAAKNHATELPDIHFDLRKLKLNLNGFFWKSNGFFNSSGEVLRVPHSSLKSIHHKDSL